MKTTHVCSFWLTLLACCATAAQASAQFRPAQMRASEAAPWSPADCMARAKLAFDVEGYFVDSTGGDSYGARKGPAHAYIICNPSPGGGVVWSVIVASTASDESCLAERDRLASRMKNPAVDGAGGGATGRLPGGQTGGTIGPAGSGGSPTGGAPVGTSSGTSSGSIGPPPPTAAVNLALRHPAKQSSYYFPQARPDESQGAVDGVKDGGFGFHTKAEPIPWWEVDLGAVASLAEIRIYNRLEEAQKARTIEVFLSNDGRTWKLAYAHDGRVFGGADGKALLVSLSGYSGRFVRLQLAETNALHLDEVEVYGTLTSEVGGGAGTGGPPGGQAGGVTGGAAGSAGLSAGSTEMASSGTIGTRAPYEREGGINVARGRPAKQSSCYFPQARPDESQGGVDGVRNGGWGFHTKSEPNAWWQVDLGTSGPVSEIRIYNRLDEAGKARSIQVLLSNDERDWKLAYAHDGREFGGVDGRALNIDLKGYSGRFVRLQLAETNALHLDEVEVYRGWFHSTDLAAPPRTDPTRPSTPRAGGTNLALGRPARQSSYYFQPPQRVESQGAVDGQKGGGFGFHTQSEPNPWWQVDLGVVRALTEIRVFNRLDCCSERARTLQVLLSDDGANWTRVFSNNGTIFGGADGKPLIVPVGGRSARFVRLQLAETNALHLDEVEIY